MKRTDPSNVPSLPAAAARAAGLRYVTDEKPGITRHARGSAFIYRSAAGALVRDKETLKRIRSLVIPPAWTEVWICPHQNGHIQATGRDAKKRKQYRYHPRWHEVRDESKYGRVMAFGAHLPRIRRKVSSDLRKRGMSKDKVMATVLRLLETTLIRVGNDEYAQQNGSYGLTTLHNGHARVERGRITFEFKGKSGKSHRVDVHEPKLAKLVRQCQELPGQDLFCYVDADGKVRDVTSDDVNGYLREVAGDDFSAKDFRTWAGTILAAVALREFEEFSSERQAKQNVAHAVKAVAKMLGNTPTVCRKCYVHPAILDSYLSGQTIATLQQSANESLQGSLRKLRPEEAAVMMLLRERLNQAGQNGRAQRAINLTRQGRKKAA